MSLKDFSLFGANLHRIITNIINFQALVGVHVLRLAI